MANVMLVDDDDEEWNGLPTVMEESDEDEMSRSLVPESRMV